MIFKGKEITNELFFLDDSRLNPLGLEEYANNIGEKLGIKYAFAIKMNGEQYETALYSSDDNTVIIPARFVEKGLSEKVYRATKGAIDHETGHVLWPDDSYFSEKNENNKDKDIIENIGRIIDDIRIERKMIQEFGVDKKNFKYFTELLYIGFIPRADSMTGILVTNLSWMVNEIYRDTNSSFLKNYKISGKILYLKSKLITIIDNYLVSGEKTVDVARKILVLLSSENNQKVKIIKKINKNDFEIEIEGTPACIGFSPEIECNFNEGDEMTKEDIISLLDYIIYLVPKSNQKLMSDCGKESV